MQLLIKQKKIAMQIKIRLAEPFWRTVGERNITVELIKGAAVSNLLAELRRKFPALGQEMDEFLPMIFLGDDEANDDLELKEGMLLHFVWPIAGG